MKLPRDLSGVELAGRLELLGYRATRQEGSHIRLTASTPPHHHVTVPAHPSLKVGTLHSILRLLEHQTGLDRDTLMGRLFG